MKVRQDGHSNAHGAKPLRSNAASYRPEIVDAIRDVIDRLNIPKLGRTFVEQALLAPSRMTGAARHNLSGRYPSTRMGVTIQFESGTLELPAIDELEHDRSVIGYCDQTPKIKLSYRGADGRTKSYLVTPDFLVIRAGRLVLVECKPIEVVRRKAASDPDLYTYADGSWICPPAQREAGDRGFEHELWTEEHFNVIKRTNLTLLSDYLFLRDGAPAHETIQPWIDEVCEQVRGVGVITIGSLLQSRPGLTIDHVYASIATGRIAADIGAAPLSRHETCRVYADQVTMRAMQGSANCIVQAGDWTGPTVIDLKPGAVVEWDGLTGRVVNAGVEEIHFQREDGGLLSLNRDLVAELIESKRLVQPKSSRAVVDGRLAAAQKFILQCRAEDLEVANERLATIWPVLQGVARAEERTVRRWVRAYRDAEASYGYGFPGLVPNYVACGNRQRRLLEDQLKIVTKKIDELWLDNRNINKKRVHEAIDLECKGAGLPTPGYSWLCRFIEDLPRYQAKAAREGEKAAYSIAPRQSEAPEAVLNAEPVRNWEGAHIDHTQIDVEAICSETGENLGRPWVTVMIDHHSRRILGFFLTFNPPSYRSVLMTLRDCVRRYGRLPDTIVVDGGKEFRSTWFEVTCAFYQVRVTRRPPRQARFGAQIERFFGSHNTMLLHTLTGNTQLRKNVRQMTPAVDPAKAAVWTLGALNELLCDFYFEVYDKTEHSGILCSPLTAFNRSLVRHGTRDMRRLVYDQDFLIMTCPSTDKGHAKVQADGVKINYFYYNSPHLRKHLGTSVKVRYEPFDISAAWAFVDGRWVRLRCRFDNLLQGLGEREIALVTEEYKRRYGEARRRRLNDTSLAEFLREVRKKELLLIERKRAMEQHITLTAGRSSPSPEEAAEKPGPDLPILDDITPDLQAPVPVEVFSQPVERAALEPVDFDEFADMETF
jgi:putative transposase